MSYDSLLATYCHRYVDIVDVHYILYVASLQGNILTLPTLSLQQLPQNGWSQRVPAQILWGLQQEIAVLQCYICWWRLLVQHMIQQGVRVQAPISEGPCIQP